MPPDANQPDLDLESIGAPEAVSETPDPKTTAESDSLEAHAREIRRLQREDFGQTIIQRKLYAKLIFLLACVWLTCILVISVLQGLGVGREPFYFFHFIIKFQLDSSVMIALIATTTANIIGVLIIVMKYLFNSPKPPQRNS